MKKVLVFADHHVNTYNWRRELMAELMEMGYEVHLVLPYGDRIEKFKKMGCQYTDVEIDRRGKSIGKDIKLLRDYYRLIQNYRPSIVLTYGTKPNIYGGMACRALKVPYIENINGLGSVITKKKSLFERFIQCLYKISAKKAKCVFFQNKTDRQYCINQRIVKGDNELVPGSGVNLEHFTLLPYPEKGPVVFTYIARVMKEKGIDEFLGAAEYIMNHYPGEAKFNVLGFCEEAYEDILEDMHNRSVICFCGMQEDVRPYIRETHCVVMPSFYGEGMSNSLLESAACGRPIVTTNLPGRGEIVDDGVTGFVVEPQDTDGLIQILTRFMSMDNSKRKDMGIRGREKMVKEFDRKIVVQKYIEQIEEKEC